MPPPSISGIVSAKRLLSQKLARSAARKRTHVWNKVMNESLGLRPKTSKLPPGFKGNKYQYANLLKNRITNYALRHPKKYSGYLFRGVKNREHELFDTRREVEKINPSSFTKDFKTAKHFSGKYGAIVRLKPGKKPLASINYTNGKFQSEWNKGGTMWSRGTEEYEVLLPPGTFYLKHESVIENKNMNIPVFDVQFVPKYKNTRYLHTQYPVSKSPKRYASKLNTRNKYLKTNNTKKPR